MKLALEFEDYFNLSGGILVALDKKGDITHINEQACKLLGYKQEELIGQNWFELILPSGIKEVLWKNYMDLMSSRVADIETAFENDGENTVNTKSGALLNIRWRNFALKDADDSIVGTLSSGTDVTDSKVYENTKKLLKEKELELKEVHHRMKNNMQLISSLINLQALKIKDPNAREAYKKTQGRINSMAMLHEKLYSSQDLTQVDLAMYIRSLAYDMFNSYLIDSDKIKLELKLDKMTCDMSKAVHCGLILNELLTNSFKYAFPGGKTGSISIELKDVEGLTQLIFSDTGVGIPDHVNPRETDSLGMQIIFTLIEQMNGTVELDLSSGTSFKLICE